MKQKSRVLEDFPDQSADHNFSLVLRSFDALEKWLAQKGVANADTHFIDFDLAPAPEAPLASLETRAEVLEALDGLMSRPDVQNDFGLRRRVQAMHAYIRDLENGGTTPHDQYFHATSGIAMTPVPAAQVQAYYNRYMTAMKQLGLPPETGPEGVARCDRTVAPQDAQAFIGLLSRAHDGDIERHTGRRPDYDLRVEFQDRLDEWRPAFAGISGTGRDFLMRFNAAALSKGLMGENGIRRVFFHEVKGHAVHAALMRDAIEQGKLPPSYGLTFLAGPEQFQMEGLAQLMEGMNCPEKGNAVLSAYTASGGLSIYATHNALYRHWYQGADLQQAAEYMAGTVPYLTSGVAQERLRAITDSSLWRSLYPVYGQSRRLFDRIHLTGDRELQGRFLTMNFNQWMSAPYLKNVVDQMMAGHRLKLDATRNPA